MDVKFKYKGLTKQARGEMKEMLLLFRDGKSKGESMRRQKELYFKHNETVVCEEGNTFWEVFNTIHKEIAERTEIMNTTGETSRVLLEWMGFKPKRARVEK